MSVAQTCKSYAQERSAKEILMPALIVSKTVKESQRKSNVFILFSAQDCYEHPSWIRSRAKYLSQNG
jgi:hypothetical protein